MCIKCLAEGLTGRTHLTGGSCMYLPKLVLEDKLKKAKSPSKVPRNSHAYDTMITA